MASLVLSSCGYQEEAPLFQHLSTHIMELDSRKMIIDLNHSSALASVVFVNGNDEEAMRRWEKVRDECRRVNGDEHASTLWVSYQIAFCLFTMERLEEAEELIRKVVEAQGRVLRGDDDDVLSAYKLLGDILRMQHKTEEGEKILKRLLALNENENGPEHRRTLGIQWSLATNLHDQKRYSEAEELSRSVLPIMKEVLGEEDDVTLQTLNMLSGALVEQRKWAEAEDILSELITKSTTTRGKHHPDTLVYQYNFTLCLVEKESFDEAEKMLREVVAAQEKIIGKEHPHTIYSRNRLEYVIQQRNVPRSTKSQPPRSPSNNQSSPESTRKSDRSNHFWNGLLFLFNPERRTSRVEGSRKKIQQNK
jgi:tetratricopeptide (TPR) repeat protein